MDNIEEKICSFNQNELNIKEKLDEQLENKINDQLENKINDQDGNLSGNKVKTEIEPTTTGNNVNISLCSCTFIMSCIIS